MLLNLPVFAPEVPAIIEFNAAGERHMRLVLAMSRMGLIHDDDLNGLSRTAITSGALRALIEKGWQREIGQYFTFKCLSAEARFLIPRVGDDEEFISPEGKAQVAVSIHGDTPDWIVIGPAFSAIEALHPGLGRKALHCLEGSLCHFGMPHTAGGAFQLCEQIYWMGEQDETAALEEYGDEADEADMPRRADLFNGIPEWCYLTSVEGIPQLTDEEFAELAVRYAEHPTGKILTALALLNHIDRNDQPFAPPHDEYGWVNEPPIVCGWNEVTDFEAIFDDNDRYFQESGEIPPWIGCVPFEPTEQGISESLPIILHTGRVLSALDAALFAITEYQP